MKINITGIVIGIILAAIFALGGFFLGKKWAGPPPESIIIPTRVIDSLYQNNRVLTDSLAVVRAKKEIITQTVTRYREKHDTIRLSGDALTIVQNLRAIALTPIQE